MGYRSDVYICIPKKDLYILQGDSFLYYCDIKELENNLLLIQGEDINLYHTTWDNFINLIENCSMFHWISIGEDGAIQESSNTSLLEVEHIIHTPTQLGEYSKEEESNLVKQIFLILKKMYQSHLQLIMKLENLKDHQLFHQYMVLKIIIKLKNKWNLKILQTMKN